MTKIDLTALANAPGFGKPKQALIKAGYWDDDGPGEKTYIVNVFGTVEVSEAVTVKAKTAKEAQQKASYSANIDNVESAEIVGVIQE